MTLENGTLLHARYRIVECLAHGGMGSVYSAMDENLGLVVAVKENLFTTEEYSRQFRLEAIILANLRHPNLPRVSDHFTIADQGQYLVMDFIEGEDLRERMERVGPLSEDDVIVIGAAICDALTYLHTRTPPILHRDIKPGNVKIAPNGHIVLVDFGLAKVFQGNQATTVGARAMTPGYSPPEQYGTARTDPRSDIYSLGATLYAAISGVIPEDGLARAMENVHLSSLRKRNPSTSRKLVLAIETAMAVDPMDRFQTAEDFKSALLYSKSKVEQPVGAYSITPPPPSATSNALTEGDPRPSARLAMDNSTLEEHQFVSPRRKQNMRESRIRRILLTAIFSVLAIGLIGINLFSPGGIRNFFSPSSPNKIPLAGSMTPTLNPGGNLTPSPDSMFISATATSTKPVPSAEVVPTTPPGFEVLQLAFASTRSGLSQIYLTDMQGHVTQLTKMPEGACQPAWSPDGARLVFISPCKVHADTYRGASLYLINADGSGLQPLSTVPGGDFEPDWSFDGIHIAFTSIRTGHLQIYSYDLSTGLTTRLIRTPLGVDARQPVWSPDGKEIAFALRRNADVYQIWLMSDTGKDQQQLVRSGDQYSDTNPEWSQDGKLILFHQTKVGKFSFPNLVMMLMEPDATPVILNMGVLSIGNVDYSPDGFWLAYENTGDHGMDIYYMTVMGAEKTALAADAADDFDPAWQPFPKP